MKPLINKFIVVSNKKDWKKLLLIYSSYDPKVPDYDWEGPFQYFRISKDNYTGWNCFQSLSEVYQSKYIEGHDEIYIEDFLINY